MSIILGTIIPEGGLLSIADGDFTISGDVGIGVQVPEATLDVSGTARISGDMSITSGGLNVGGVARITNTTASTSTSTGALAVAGGVGIAGVLNVASKIYVGAVGGVGTLYLGGGSPEDADYDMGVIETRAYASNKSEMVLFKGNDVSGSDGPDRIRLRAAAIAFDTYSSNSSDRAAENIRMFINSSGQVGIGTTSPGFLLDVAGTCRFTGVTQITSSTASTSTTSGALVVSGGVGIAGDLNADSINALDGISTNYIRFSGGDLKQGTVEKRYGATSSGNYANEQLFTTEFLNKTPRLIRVSPDMNVTDSVTNTVMLFNSYLFIDTAGTYTFGTNSDNVSDLFIDGKLVAHWYGDHDKNATTTSPGGVQKTMYLNVGYHRAVARLGQAGSFVGLHTLWKKPGDADFSEIPANVCYYDPRDLISGDITGGVNIAAALDLSGGQLNFSNTTSNVIMFPTSGVAGPELTTRSVGTRLVMFPTGNAERADYAWGMESNAMWFSVGDSANSFKFYHGTTAALQIRGTGTDILQTTASTSATSGALTVAGGVGIAGDLNAGGTAAISGGSLSMNNGSSNSILFSTAGVASPTFSTRSAGTKLVVYPQAITSSSTEYAIGIEGSAMWYSTSTAVTFHKFYNGITPTLSISGSQTAVLQTTASTSTTSGALVVSGGVGIAGAAYLGGLMRVTDTTASTDATTGALTVAGGAGIAGSLHVGGGLVTSGNNFIGGNTVVRPATQAHGFVVHNLSADQTYFKDTVGPSLDGRVIQMSVANAGTPIFYTKVGTTYYTATISSSTYFTGQHMCCSEDFTQYDTDELAGLIVYATGEYLSKDSSGSDITGKDAIQINESLPKIKLASINTDKRVFGVITDSNDMPMLRDDGEVIRDYHEHDYERRIFGRVRVNSLGEGGIWVCSKHGNIENGDYITSCTVPGYGAVQADDILRSYTVAKATCAVDFMDLDPIKFRIRFLLADGSVVEDSGTADFIAVFIGCTYHCG
jgi:hypothetical protein